MRQVVSALIIEAEIGPRIASAKLAPPQTRTEIELHLYYARIWRGTPQPKTSRRLGRFSAAQLATLKHMPGQIALMDEILQAMKDGR